MKQFILLCLLTLLYACKEKGIENEQHGLKDFKVEGVPSENISITKESITIRLPADYSGGDKIKVSFKGSKENLEEEWAQLTGWVNGEISFEGISINILVINSITTIYIPIYVIPYKPLEITGQGEPVKIFTDGKYHSFRFSVMNWGTIHESDSIRTIVTFKNKKTGQIINAYRYECHPPTTPGGPVSLAVEVEPEIEEGEYDIFLSRRGQMYLIPDSLIVTTGKPTLSTLWGMPSVFGDNKSTTLHGYNLFPSYLYELQLKNDFTESIRLKLTPISKFELKVTIPNDMPASNYEMDLLVDGKKVDIENLSQSDNLFIVSRDSLAPRLLSLSNISQRYVTAGGLDVFHPITTFKRGEEILITESNLFFGWAQGKARILHLTNRETQKEYLLEQNSFFPNPFFSQPFFPIPDNVPPGKYEVYYSVGNYPKETYSSARYHKIITIE